MATDFFQRQDESRQRTTRLLLLFGLGVATLVGLIYLLAAFVFLYMGAPPDQPPSLWDPTLFGAVAACVLVVVTAGSLLKAAQLSAGGKAVALLLDGQEVLGTTTDLRERRLLNVVEEMAIAAGVPMPPVYVLPEKQWRRLLLAGGGAVSARDGRGVLRLANPGGRVAAAGIPGRRQCRAVHAQP
jgi:Zn-dependent protease with chaperone function